MYQICSRCIMDSTCDPNLELDNNGVCKYCRNYDVSLIKTRKMVASQQGGLEGLFRKIREEGKNKEYDCIIGMSGGVDSAYVAYLAKKYNLRPLVVHVDTGWNSEVAVQNIEKLCKALEFDLHTIVLDWPTMKELQRAYMFSGLANIDVPQDHSFLANVWGFAKKYKIKYCLNGYNLATEGILSSAFMYINSDWRNIKDVYKKCGRNRISLKKYPHVGLIEYYKIRYGLSYLKHVTPLEYINYSKKEAIAFLEAEFGWHYYGGKHYESRFTKFCQETYLIDRYGWEKRRDHLSSLIVGGEMTREEALKEIDSSPSTEAQRAENLEYILKKLDISIDQWQEIIKAPYKKGTDYKSYDSIIRLLSKIKRLFVKD